MTIKFNHPPVSNPFNNFCPEESTHYPTGDGVYIYGMKLTINDEEKFVPMYVGNGNLKDRLTKHYTDLKTNGKSRKELFNFSEESLTLKELKGIYNDMLIYDRLTNYKPCITPQQPTVFNLEALIYFQCMSIYDYKLNTNIYKAQAQLLIKNNPNGDLNQFQINKLSPKPQEYFNLVQKTKKNFTTKFYYIYAEYPDVNLPPDFFKHEAKNALKKISIYTTAKHIDKEIPQALTVDLSNIQNELVNVSGSHYPQKLVL